MSTRQDLKTSQVILRSFTPSPVSFFLCLIIGFIMVAVNIVLLSVDIGTSLPGVLDGQWAIAYTEHVVQPLTEFLSNNTFNKLLVAFLWGMAGFAVYVGFEYLVHGTKSLSQTRSEVQMARGRIIQQPRKDQFWKAVWWRLGVIVGFVVFIVAMQPLLRHALAVAPSFVVSTNLLNDSVQAGLAVAIWALLLHGLVVFFRLYTLRTRIFGDDKLY
jgi:hypothetical protein